MDFKNFFYRFILSLVIIILYLLSIFTNQILLIYLGIIIYLFIFIEVIINFNKFKLLTLFYVLLSSIFFIIASLNNFDLKLFNLMILTIASFDIFSYIIGSLFGKIKILKYISPNKTLEGLLGGIFFSFFLALIFLIIINIQISINLLILIFFFILSAFLGDIIVSYIKRKNLKKDSSNLIPGHGGFFDRFDSYILSIIPYCIYTSFF